MPPGALLLWQGEPSQAPAGPQVLLWQGSTPGARSLTQYLDEHGAEVRRRYLAWGFELGETRIWGRPLHEHLKVWRAGSLWPVSMFVEQSLWKQHSLETLLKVLALGLWLDRERPAALVLAGRDRDLRRVLAALCRERGLDFTWLPLPSARSVAAPHWRQRLPQLLQGCAAPLYFLLRSRRLPRLSLPGARTRPRVLICAPFINFSTDERSGFVSNYWTELPPLLVREGCEPLWLHMFYPHGQVPTAAAANEVLARLAAAGRSHGFVDAHISATGLFRVQWQWLSVALKSLAVGLCLRWRFAQRPQESFWPLLRRDFARAFRGLECAAALFYLECFDRALRHLPHLEEGIYLMENQGWERALIRAWRRHQHGRLTAVAHSTVRFWDLRYHTDPRRYQCGFRGIVPEPDVVAVNGTHARMEFLATCEAREALVECEALRYLRLGGPNAAAARTRGPAEPPRLLVLGDFLAASTGRLLQLVAEALPGAPADVWVKPHPNCPIDPTQAASAALRIVDEPVTALAPRVDLVLASNTTSAALEAYLMNVAVLVYDDRSGVNFSPLRAARGVRFVEDAGGLRKALLALGEPHEISAPRSTQFFHTEAALPRWRDYLGFAPSRVAASDRVHGTYNEDLAT